MAAFNNIEGLKIHGLTNQTTILHLSKSLTVINSVKSDSTLLGDDFQKAESLSSRDIPSLRVSAAIHILSRIIGFKVSLKLKILNDITINVLRMFFKTVTNSKCLSNVRKAYTKLLIQLLDATDADTMDIQDDVDATLSLCLERFDKFATMDLLVMLAPALRKHKRFCTMFVSAIVWRFHPDEVDFFLTKTPSFSWDLPFFFDSTYFSIRNTWYRFGVIMAVINLTQTKKLECLTLQSLSILHLALSKTIYSKPSLSSTQQPDLDLSTFKTQELDIPKQIIDQIFLQISDHLIVSLGKEDTGQNGWDLMMLFMVHCSASVIISVIQIINY